LFGLLVKLEVRAAVSTGYVPPVIVLEMRSDSMGWIWSSTCPGPTRMPKPPRTTVLPLREGVKAKETRGWMLFLLPCRTVPPWGRITPWMASMLTSSSRAS
jgi:hypothetical protein